MTYKSILTMFLASSPAVAGISDFMSPDLKISGGYSSRICSKNGFECICKDVGVSGMGEQWICYMHDTSTGYCSVLQSQINGGLVPDQDCKFFKNAKIYIKLDSEKK